jgi:hypothetical protein
MAASDYVPIFSKNRLASCGVSTDEAGYWSIRRSASCNGQSLDPIAKETTNAVTKLNLDRRPRHVRQVPLVLSV